MDFVKIIYLPAHCNVIVELHDGRLYQEFGNPDWRAEGVAEQKFVIFDSSFNMRIITRWLLHRLGSGG